MIKIHIKNINHLIHGWLSPEVKTQRKWKKKYIKAKRKNGNKKKKCMSYFFPFLHIISVSFCFNSILFLSFFMWGCEKLSEEGNVLSSKKKVYKIILFKSVWASWWYLGCTRLTWVRRGRSSTLASAGRSGQFAWPGSGKILTIRRLLFLRFSKEK